MESKIAQLIDSLKTIDQTLYNDEAKTKQGMIVKILFHLGWDVHDINEVVPEYSLNNIRVDYAI